MSLAPNVFHNGEAYWCAAPYFIVDDYHIILAAKTDLMTLIEQGAMGRETQEALLGPALILVVKSPLPLLTSSLDLIILYITLAAIESWVVLGLWSSRGRMMTSA